MLTAIIPVRAGSRRLKNKNIQPFGNSNLLCHKIEQLKKCKHIDNIVVSSDSDEYLNIAKKEGVLVHKRAIEYCDEKTKTFGEVVEHICSSVNGDHILWATCTSPLVTPELYDKAILQYLNEVPKYGDSLVAFEPFKRYIWNENGPLNYQLGLKHVPSQQLEQLYFVTDGICIAPRQKMIEWKYFHGIKPIKFILDKKSSVDIDDELDLACARAYLNLNN